MDGSFEKWRINFFSLSLRLPNSYPIQRGMPYVNSHQKLAPKSVGFQSNLEKIIPKIWTPQPKTCLPTIIKLDERNYRLLQR